MKSSHAASSSFLTLSRSVCYVTVKTQAPVSPWRSEGQSGRRAAYGLPRKLVEQFRPGSGFGEQRGVVFWSPCHEHASYMPFKASDCAINRARCRSGTVCVRELSHQSRSCEGRVRRHMCLVLQVDTCGVQLTFFQKPFSRVVTSRGGCLLCGYHDCFSSICRDTVKSCFLSSL